MLNADDKSIIAQPEKSIARGMSEKSTAESDIELDIVPKCQCVQLTACGHECVDGKSQARRGERGVFTTAHSFELAIGEKILAHRNRMMVTRQRQIGESRTRAMRDRKSSKQIRLHVKK